MVCFYYKISAITCGRMISAPTAVTERAWFSQRSITQNYALPTVNSCEKAGNSGILCETRREVLRTRERTSVRDQVLRFSQRSITQNYALPT